ncbi:putative DNA polymerase POL4 [Patellaria atrata CBS 101060]|uniref:DNA polymerase n=1 Tax=Patellaria atrata CBS 101060 TaxID=1346257 RepID=A0A9P4SHH2_9PEZI|nr:putative DNA polymerase POL4 [Patellaria atrata CBS 101060]
MKGKRNKGKEEKIVKQPEARQVFKGMYFYFYPNNTINEVRRVRIIKAIEFGAEWVKDWQEGITHVVVSKGHTYPHLLKFLKMPSLPIDIVVVNDDFIPGCIEYRGLMSMETLKDIHQVEGHKTNMAPPDIPSSSPDTRRSLQIKPSKKQMQPSQTPSVTEQSSLEVAHALRAADERSLAQLPTGAADPLFELMKEAKELQELPIDTEDEDSNAAISPIEDDSDESSPKKGSKASASRDGNSWQDNFQCMHKNTGMGGSDNPNARTIQVLQQMCEYYNKMQDQWRTIAYRKAIASLRKETKKISTRKEARNLPYVGERLAAKIEEIFFTDRLRRLDNAQQEPTDAVLQMFMKIYGVGFSQASKWVNQGYRSLEDLSARAKLTENQRIGIRHFEDFNSRIPRKEVEQHGKIVRETLQAMDPAFEITIMGSYRRGMKDSGDIDLIITKKNASLQDIRSIVITTLVPKLSAFGFLKAGLATMYNDSGSKWHGASVLPGSKVWRRIDLLLVPWNEIGAAMLYFTGNDIFNRSIRLLASKKGMRLNQRGLYKDVSRGQNRQKLTEGTLVESRSERKIFQILGVPWRDPVHRIC